MASFSPQERAYYDRLFSVIDKDQSGVLPGQDALPFLVSSSLPQQTLGEVWALADPDNNGFLTRDGWYKAARLIGWMQKGGQAQVEESLVSRAGPFPTFAGQAPPPQQAPLSAQTTGQQRQPPQSSSLPLLTAADRAKFTKIFVGCGPQNGLVSGDKARDVFLKSQLGYDKLGQIWTLADTQQRGSLDLSDFIIGMYLIQSCMANSSLSLPATLPPTVYEQASGGRAPPTSPIARQNTGNASPLRAQYTGQLQPQSTGQGLAAQNTGRSASGQPASTAQWDITPDAKATSDRFFAQLDPQGKGVIDGDVAVPFMLLSQLDETALASIWDLADIRKEGKLTKDEFAVAMHLINGKLAGKEVPAVLPNSLIPPSLRGEYGGQQEPTQGPSSVIKDLFDLFADDPPAPPPPVAAAASPTRSQPPQPQPFSTAAFLPQPPSRKNTAPPPPASRALSPNATGASQNAYSSNFSMPQTARQPSSDLLGDDSAPAYTSVPDRSVEIGNKQNQLANTERSNADLTKQRADLEKSAESSAAQLEELEQRLSSARVKHEAETKSVTDLRVRVGEQQSKIKTLNADLISAESDLSAMRSEKDELGQALLRDKEEVRGLQKRMKEVEDEKTGLKLVLEKLKKEARQQKGMVTIAKKQLTTAEGSRDAVQGDIRAEEASQAAAAASPSPVHEAPASTFSPSPGVAAGIPLPATPQALSPVPTGMSSRSNNPFDRLRTARSPAPGPETPQEQHGLGPTALLGAAAGVVAAGAATLFEAAKHVVSPEEEHPPLPQTPALDTSTHNEAARSVPSIDPSIGESSAIPEVGAVHPATSTEQDPFGASDSFSQAPPAADVDPFGAPAGSTQISNARPAEDDFETSFGDSFSTAQQTNFGATTTTSSALNDDLGGDFGTTHQPTSTATAQPTQPHHHATDFDADFDSFDPPPIAVASTGGAATSDFDSAFSDFDAGNSIQTSEGLPSGIPKSAIPYLRPEAERTASTQAVAADSAPDSPVLAPTPTPAPASISSQEVQRQARGAEHDAGDASSDEDEGPEDLDQPKKLYSATTGASQNTARADDTFADNDSLNSNSGVDRGLSVVPVATSTQSVQSPSTELDAPKGRRSAPPPPSAKSTALAPAIDDFDPFGAPAMSAPGSGPAPASGQTFGQLPPGAAPSIPAHAQTASSNAFDEDDFDFSDQPPVRVDESHNAQPGQTHHQAVSSASRDDFDFDDEFDKPSTGQGSEGSNGMSKSYEMVSPSPSQPGLASNHNNGNGNGNQHNDDPWGGLGDRGFGLGSVNTNANTHANTQSSAGQGSGFSFDDAFGGDFEPVPAGTSQPHPQPQASSGQFAPPPGAPPGKADTLSAPPLPQRRDSEAQADDIEDVKKLCAMGFGRGLVIEALAANSYDFQKTLNVLLQ